MVKKSFKIIIKYICNVDNVGNVGYVGNVQCSFFELYFHVIN